MKHVKVQNQSIYLVIKNISSLSLMCFFSNYLNSIKFTLNTKFIFSVKMHNSTDPPLCFAGEESLLMHAISESNFDIANQLLQQNQDVNYKCKHGMNAMLVAIQMEDEKCVEMLVNKKAHLDEICTVKIDIETEMDMTPLILACALNSVSIAKSLIKGGANVDKKLHNGINALMVATDNNNTDCVNLLLEHNASPNNETGSKSPLMFAAINKNAECMKNLLKHDSKLNTQDQCGNTALMFSARALNVQCLQLLIDAGAELNITDTDGFHALLIAQCCQNNNACTSLLIRAGSSVNMTNQYNETPLSYAIDADNEVIFDHLIQYGADVNQCYADGYTPMWCVMNSYEQIHEPESYLRKLLINGADPNIGRYPPLTLAAQYSHISCIEILLKGGANVNAVDPEFGTTLSIAGYMGSTTMIRMAWNYQAKINITSKEPDIKPRICDDEALTMLFAMGQKWSFFESDDSDIPNQITESRNDKSLKNICRKAIRSYIIKSARHIDLFREIPLLQLPNLINSYLLYNIKM